MASDKDIEMYVPLENILRQEDRTNDEVRQSHRELTWNNVCNIFQRATTSSLACRKHVQSILIGVLYILVLFSIFWNVYSEGKRKDELISIKKEIANVKTGLEENIDDSKGITDNITIRFSEQQQIIDNLTKKLDLYDNTMSNNSIISENTKNVVSVKKVVKNIQKDLEESISSVNDLQRVTDELNIAQNDLSTKFTDLEKQVRDLCQATRQKPTVAFNVIDAASVIGQNIIKFSNIILNEGNAYNNDTGLFTAPVDGIYQFNAHICGGKDKDVDYFIKVNDSAIVTGEFRVPDGADDTKCTSFSAVAMVREGENVRVGGMSGSVLYESSNDMCSFSGTLIQNV